MQSMSTVVRDAALSSHSLMVTQADMSRGDRCQERHHERVVTAFQPSLHWQRRNESDAVMLTI